MGIFPFSHVNSVRIRMDDVYFRAVASPVMGHWGTCPPSTSRNFIVSSLWSKSESQLSKYFVICEISWCRCQQLTALSISTSLVTKLSHRAAAAPGRECPMTWFPSLPLLATNPHDATVFGDGNVKLIVDRVIPAHLFPAACTRRCHRRQQAWARGGTCSLWKCCEVFLCISSYSKTLSRRIICALFTQPVVSFWGLCLQTPTRTPPGDFRPQTPNFAHPSKKKPAGAHGRCFTFWPRNVLKR